ncbi:MAG: hypothetical protein RL490_1277 [Pseudomonadota bacterium]|jgi:Tfp pilus assembly protein PilF
MFETANRALADQRFADAIPLLEQALAQAPAGPHTADAWFNLGFARRMQLDLTGALAAYDQALALDISQPETVHLNKAALQADLLHDVGAARASLAAAIAANPAFTLAWLNLGQLEEDAGNPLAARTAYETVLSLQPKAGRALARLAAIDIFEGKPEAAHNRLTTAAIDPANTVDAIETEFALAAACDALGLHDAAFGHAETANDAQRRFTVLPYRPAEQARQIDALIAMFPKEAPVTASTGLRPIFICGLFRSGSTLVESLINRRLGVAMGGELGFTPWFIAQQQGLNRASRDAMVAAYRDGYTRFCRTVLGDVTRFTDKRMDNFLYIGLIKRAFPDALIVHTLRNPVDNFLSMYFLPFADSLAYASDWDDMLDFYRQYRRLMAHWQDCYGDDIITLRYDDLVADPDAVIGTLAARLGVETAATPPGEQIIRTASAWQVRQPLHGRSSGRWRQYQDHVGEIAALLQQDYPALF